MISLHKNQVKFNSNIIIVCVKLFSVTFNPKENILLYGKLFNSG
ncbi:hypothetical protein GCM10008932_20680 [Alkalibacterium iburiense]|uniref:Uncharacterized protein n=1 Tax=Alkalibacterium iburiense TaxID=290589 RepID=A0ABN0XNV4_9LACT